MITANRLRELLNYDSETGAFTWRCSRMGHAKAGDSAGSLDVQGYVQIKICGKNYRAHRLAWLYVHGCWPQEQIDHVNRNRADNRLANLRECSAAENCQNRSMYKNNTSGIVGVSWGAEMNKWQVNIMTNGLNEFIGYFASKDAAASAYAEAKARLHTFHPHAA